MTGTLTTIARTISEELERAVEAAEQAQSAGLDALKETLRIAVQTRSEALGSARELEQEAARLVSESLKIRENAEKAFESMMQDCFTSLAALKPAPTLRRVNGKRSKELPAAADHPSIPN